jgi:histidine ammonia-lyase
MNTIILNGSDLSRHQVNDVAFLNAKVQIDSSKIQKSRDFVEKKVAEGCIVYGITTGFGSNVDKQIKAEKAEELQVNLLRSHACGVGEYFSPEISRAVMTIRLNTLLKGFSGIRLETVQQLAFLINNEIHPLIPEQGSVGASGDLCPLSHMALPLIGEGEIEYKGKHYRTEDFLKTEEAKKIGFKPITLSYKEGLALNNGTTIMAALAAIALNKADNLFKTATLSSALIFTALGARKESFSFPKIHEARMHAGQIKTAKILTTLLEGSKLVGITQKQIVSHVINTKLVDNARALSELEKINAVQEHDKQEQIPDSVINILKAEDNMKAAEILAFAKKKWKPQDSYSVRCVPQVFGASLAAIEHVKSIVENELNAACDNPLIFPDDDVAISGGNFHGQPIALVMDYLKLAISELGNITERQINKMVDSSNNDCLPSFLVGDSGLNSGLMIAQYAAAAVASENKVLVHPASADSIPTCENTEDHVSMGTIAARQALQIIANVEKISAISVMTGLYALSLRLEQFGRVGMPAKAEELLSPAVLEFYNELKNSSPIYKDGSSFLKYDRFLAPEIKAMSEKFEDFAKIADKYIGKIYEA